MKKLLFTLLLAFCTLLANAQISGGMLLRQKPKTSTKPSGTTKKQRPATTTTRAKTKSELRTEIKKDIEELDNILTQEPYEINDYMELIGAQFVGNYVIYIYECDEEYISISQLAADLRDNHAERVRGIVYEFRNSSPDAYRQFKQAGVGIIIRYVGDDSETACSIAIEPEDM